MTHRPTLSIPTVGTSMSRTAQLVNECLERRNLMDRVKSCIIEPGEKSSLYRVQLPSTTIPRSLSVIIQRSDAGVTYGQAMIGADTLTIAGALVAGGLRIALAQPPSRIPHTFSVVSLSAGGTESLWRCDTGVQGIEAYTRELAPELTECGVTVTYEGNGVRFTGLAAYAQQLRAQNGTLNNGP